jgi:glycosyltransferase involved in cell wall biosynthesis
MEPQNPQVSIGLPVFNGEKYLESAIDSILAQTFTDFELIICDNASTDRTEEICRKYSAQDSRIRYYRNPTNIGGSRNQNLTIQLARGEYFHLGADDDLLAPDLLVKCVEVLEQNVSLALCYTLICEIDENGKVIGELSIEELATSEQPHERFCNLLKPHRVDFLYGLIRTNALRKTELEPSYLESDLIFACELGLYGQFYRIPECLFYRRSHSAAFTSLNFAERIVWTHSQNQMVPEWLRRVWIAFYSYIGLLWLEAAHLFRVIFRAPLTARERIVCLTHSANWLLRKFLISKSWKLRQRMLLTREIFAFKPSILKRN